MREYHNLDYNIISSSHHWNDWKKAVMYQCTDYGSDSNLKECTEKRIGMYESDLVLCLF